MPEMGRFGLLMTIGVSLAFFLSVVGLPALFIIEEKIIYYGKRKMHFGIEKEFVLAKENELKIKKVDNIKVNKIHENKNSGNNQNNNNNNNKNKK